MAEYVTTNIRFPKELHRELKRRALEADKSLAEIVRESVIQYLAGPPVATVELPDGMTKDEWESDSLWMIGTDPVRADVTDGAVNHDVHLYGLLSGKVCEEASDE